MTRHRYFTHKCRTCNAEKLIRASKTAQYPSCDQGHGRMPYIGIRELSDEEFSAAQSRSVAPQPTVPNDLTRQAIIEADYLP